MSKPSPPEIIQHGEITPAISPANNRPKHDGGYVIMVTGAGKGIGYEICLAYARVGATGLIISSRTQSDLDRLTKALHEINPKLEVLSQICDTGKPEDVEALANATKERFNGRLDVAIANAGIAPAYVPGENGVLRLPRNILEDDSFARVIDINFIGSYNVAKYFTPLLLSKSNQSPIRAFVVISSMAALLTTSSFIPASYNISKAAVNRMVEHMAQDFGKDGLLAFSVHPGGVRTPMTQHHVDTEDPDWATALNTDIDVCGAWLTWLTKDRKDWLNGRLMSVRWDVDTLEQRKDHIIEQDTLKLKFTL